MDFGTLDHMHHEQMNCDVYVVFTILGYHSMNTLSAMFVCTKFRALKFHKEGRTLYHICRCFDSLKHL